VTSIFTGTTCMVWFIYKLFRALYSLIVNVFEKVSFSSFPFSPIQSTPLLCFPNTISNRQLILTASSSHLMTASTTVLGHMRWRPVMLLIILKRRVALTLNVQWVVLCLLCHCAHVEREKLQTLPSWSHVEVLRCKKLIARYFYECNC
jgi:hypothetical protein